MILYGPLILNREANPGNRPSSSAGPPVRPEARGPTPNVYGMTPTSNSLFAVPNLLNANPVPPADVPELPTLFTPADSTLAAPAPLPQTYTSGESEGCCTLTALAFDFQQPVPSARSSPAPWTAFNDVFGWGIEPEMDATLGSSGYGASSTDALNAAWLLCNSGLNNNHDFSAYQLPSGSGEPKRTPQDETRSEISRREKIERGDNPWVGYASTLLTLATYL